MTFQELTDKLYELYCGDCPKVEECCKNCTVCEKVAKELEEGEIQ